MRAVKPFYNALFYVLMTIAMTLVRLLYPVRALGKENLPRGRGYVLAPNHLSAIDPLFVLLARGWRKKMLIMGKGELFGKKRILDFFWAVVGCFPVERGRGDKGAIDEAAAEMRAGRSLLIFPEGTRSKTGELGRVKSGAFVVAMEAGAPIVPCVIRYRGGKPRPFHRITVVFGAPLELEALGLTGEYSAKKLRGAKQQYANAIHALEEEYKSWI